MSVLHFLRHGTKRRIMQGLRINWIENSKRGPYIRAAVLSFPLWIRSTAFAALWAQREELTRSTGIKHTFDHIVPLNHPMVCGLSVPWNIRVVPKEENARKSNQFADDLQLLLWREQEDG